MRKLLLFTWLCIAQMAAGQRTGETVFKTLGLADGLRSITVMALISDGITIFDTKQDTLYYIRRTDDIINGMTPTEFRQKQSDNEI